MSAYATLVRASSSRYFSRKPSTPNLSVRNLMRARAALAVGIFVVQGDDGFHRGKQVLLLDDLLDGDGVIGFVAEAARGEDLEAETAALVHGDHADVVHQT